MYAGGSSVRTEVRGFEIQLDGSNLVLSSRWQRTDSAHSLTADEAERLRLEMAKAQLWEWNQLEELKARAVLRYRRYLASWLVLCLAAFSAYIGYPSYYLCVFLCLLAIFLWWRAAYVERQADREAAAERQRVCSRLELHSAATGRIGDQPGRKRTSDIGKLIGPIRLVDPDNIVIRHDQNRPLKNLKSRSLTG